MYVRVIHEVGVSEGTPMAIRVGSKFADTTINTLWTSGTASGVLSLNSKGGNNINREEQGLGLNGVTALS